MGKAARVKRERAEGPPWQPLEKGVPNPHDGARLDTIAAHYGMQRPEPDDEIWLNDEYQVTVRYCNEDRSRDGICSLSIKRRRGGPVNDWRDKQAIKNEILGAEREAIELYPAESRLVDSADQSWLWVFPLGSPLPIGFDEKLVVTNEERIAALRESGGDVAASKGSQRNWRPGVPTGPDYHPGGER